MATGGITFGIAKNTLRLAVDNGVGVTDPRIMRRTDEATQELLLSTDPRTNGPLIPVGAMATYQVSAAGNFLLLPPQLENAITYFVLPPGEAYGNPDTSQGWVALNPVTYIDPTIVHDDPLIDLGLMPDPDDPTVLRRKYQYQGLVPDSIVVVTGKKRFIPLTGDNDYLIIQNVPALKMMIQAIERREARNGIAESREYKAEAIKMLSDEIVNHLSDPQDVMRRMADYRLDLINYFPATYAHIRARMALEIPGFKDKGRSELGFILNQAVREAVDHYNFLGRTERYSGNEGPNQLNYTTATLPTDNLVYTNFEILRLLALSQVTPPAGVQPPQDATPLRQQAYVLIERNLAQVVETSRMYQHVEALATATPGTRAFIVASIGLELPRALEYPVKRLGQFVDRAELRLMQMGLYKGCIEEFDAKVVCGHILMPERVESILAANLNAEPVDVRSVFYKYQKNGPGEFDCSCGGRIDDEGDVVLKGGVRRRRYTFHTTGAARQPTTVPATTVPPVTGGFPGVFEGIFYIDEISRMVAAETGGVALEILTNGIWERQSIWY